MPDTSFQEHCLEPHPVTSSCKGRLLPHVGQECGRQTPSPSSTCDSSGEIAVPHGKHHLPTAVQPRQLPPMQAGQS